MAERLKIEDLPPQSALKDFAQEFLADRKEELIELNSALDSSNFEFIKSTAHKWKGYSDPYGFQTLTQYALMLEQEALKQNSNDCKELLFEIENYLSAKEQLINANN